MLGWNIIKSAHIPLGLVPKVFDPVDVISPVGEEFGMVDAHVMEFGDVYALKASV